MYNMQVRINATKFELSLIALRVRHVKCDEDKPSCKRCVSMARVCGGYIDYLKPRNGPLPALKAKPTRTLGSASDIRLNPRPLPNTYPESTALEKRSLEYFRCRSASMMGSWLVEAFWRYQLPQMGLADPAARHMMVALAAAHESADIICEGKQNDPRLEESSRLARVKFGKRNYTLAVSHMVKNIGDTSEGNEVRALVVCGVAQVLCFLLGDFEAGMMHLHSGIEICAQWKKKGIEFPNGSLEKNLIDTFDWMSVGSKSIRDPESRPPSTEELIFHDLDSARTVLGILTRESLRVVRLRNLLPSSSTEWHRSFFIRRFVEAHYENLDAWSNRFEMLVAVQSNSTSFNMDQDREIDGLRIMRISCQLWVSIGLNPDSLQSLTLATELDKTLERFCCKWAIKNINDWNNAANFPHKTSFYPTLLLIVNRSLAQMQMKAVAVLGMVTPTSDGSIHSAFWSKFGE